MQRTCLAGSQRPSAGQRPARAIYPRGQLQAGLRFRRSQSAVPAAPNAASILAQTSSETVTRSSGLGTWPRSTNAQAPATHPRLRGFTARPRRAPKVTAVPVPLRGPSPGSATSAPSQYGASREPRVRRHAESSRQKNGDALAAALKPPVTSLPGRRRLSGAVRDKQKEAPEGRSGRRRDGAAGARGCLLGSGTRRDQVSRWGGGRGANCHLSKPTPTRPRPAARPRRPGQLGLCPPWPAPWGPPAAAQFGLPPGLSVLQVSGTPPSPRRRGARAPSQAPQCLPVLYGPGVSAWAPPGPLVTPWASPRS